MKRIGLLSDTHSFLHPNLLKHFAHVDEIWHAGDIGNIEVADTLEQLKPLRAVYGNIDGHELRKRYPEHLSFEIEGLNVYMTHIGGYPPNYNNNSRAYIKRLHPHLFISGHSHILKVMPDNKQNLLHLNPGACGKQGWHKVKTAMTFEIANAKIDKLKIIELQD